MGGVRVDGDRVSVLGEGGGGNNGDEVVGVARGLRAAGDFWQVWCPDYGAAVLVRVRPYSGGWQGWKWTKGLRLVGVGSETGVPSYRIMVVTAERLPLRKRTRCLRRRRRHAPPHPGAN